MANTPLHPTSTPLRRNSGFEDGIMWSIHSSEALLCIDSPMDLNKRQGPTMDLPAEGVEHEQEGRSCTMTKSSSS